MPESRYAASSTEPMKFRLLLPLFLLLAANPASAADPAPVAPDAFCQAAPGFAGLAARFPGYALPTDVDSPVAIELPFLFRPGDATARKARNSTICVAVAVDAAGKATEAVIYQPGRVRLSPEEHRALLASRFAPARKDGQPVGAIFVLPVNVH
jgi:hypothetical protein